MLRLSTGFRNNILKVGGASACDTMAKGVIEIRSGSQPASADDAEIGTLLVRITKSSGAYTDLVTNGISLSATGATLSKAVGEVWSGVAIASGTAGWFRHFDSTYTSGASTSASRFDGAISTSGAQLNLPSTVITLDGTTTIDSVTINFPTA
jgi:hypothetical protein